MTRRVSNRRQNQRGFALLFVFAMAAAVAIMLFLEMPRVGFERQRDKEELLVQRGEQFIRGITLFYRKNGRYPATLDELEKYNNVRYLRRRYKDPMTGQDEWRLIHVDAAGRYVDSLIHTQQQEEEKKQRHLLEADVQGIGASAISATQEDQTGSPALQRRGSDIIIPNTPGGGSRGQDADPAQQQGDPNQSAPQPVPVPAEAPPAQVSNLPQSNPGQSASPISGVQDRQAGFGQQPGGPNRSPFPAPSQTGQGQLPVQQGGFGQTSQQQQQQSGGGFGFSGGGFGMNAQAPPAQMGQSQQQQQPGLGPQPTGGRFSPQQGPGTQTGFGGSQQSTTPRQSTTYAQSNMSANPAPAIQGLLGGNRLASSTQSGPFGQNPQSGAQGGIAGVASTVDLEGIKVYNERTNYKEWEFLFDLQKLQQSMSNVGGGQGPMGGRGQSMPGNFSQGMGGQQRGPGSGQQGQGGSPFFNQGGGGRQQGPGQGGFGPPPPPSGQGGNFGFGGGGNQQQRPVAPGQRRP